MKKLLLVMVSILVLTCSCVYLPASPTTTTPAEKPVVSSFSANPSSIASGGTSTLSWSVTGATSVSLDNGIGNVAVSGTRAVAPTASTIYILTASNASGSNNATTQVLVSGTSSTPPAATGIPAVTSFSASPSSITAGATSTLSWSVSNATSVNIQPGIGNVAASGSTAVTPATSTQYILTATNSSGSNIDNTQVVVASSTPTTPVTPVNPNIHLPAGTVLVTTAYDFTSRAPAASWGSGAGNLTFPGSQADSSGFALVLNNV